MTETVMAKAPDAETASRPGAASFEVGRPLAPALLYRRSDPAELPFSLCTELEEAPGLIGQERAVEALNFALRMRGKGYNVYALGAGGTGRHSMVEDLLRHKAESEPTPPDWCYVEQFRGSTAAPPYAIAAGPRLGSCGRDESADRGIAGCVAGSFRAR